MPLQQAQQSLEWALWRGELAHLVLIAALLAGSFFLLASAWRTGEQERLPFHYSSAVFALLAALQLFTHNQLRFIVGPFEPFYQRIGQTCQILLPIFIYLLYIRLFPADQRQSQRQSKRQSRRQLSSPPAERIALPAKKFANGYLFVGAVVVVISTISAELTHYLKINFFWLLLHLPLFLYYSLSPLRALLRQLISSKLTPSKLTLSRLTLAETLQRRGQELFLQQPSSLPASQLASRLLFSTVSLLLLFTASNDLLQSVDAKVQMISAGDSALLLTLFPLLALLLEYREALPKLPPLFQREAKRGLNDSFSERAPSPVERLLLYLNLHLPKSAERLRVIVEELRAEQEQELRRAVREFEERMEAVLQLARLEATAALPSSEIFFLQQLLPELLPRRSISCHVKTEARLEIKTNRRLLKELMERLTTLSIFRAMEQVDLIVSSDRKGRIYFRFLAFHKEQQIVRRLYRKLIEALPNSGQEQLEQEEAMLTAATEKLWIEWALIREMSRILKGQLETKIIKNSFISIELGLNSLSSAQRRSKKEQSPPKEGLQLLVGQLPQAKTFKTKRFWSSTQLS